MEKTHKPKGTFGQEFRVTDDTLYFKSTGVDLSFPKDSISEVLVEAESGKKAWAGQAHVRVLNQEGKPLAAIKLPWINALDTGKWLSQNLGCSFHTSDPPPMGLMKVAGFAKAHPIWTAIIVLWLIGVGMRKDSPSTPSSPPPATEAQVTESEAPPSEPAPRRGLGITRSRLRGMYEQSGIDFVFQDSSEVDGQPRIMAKSPDGLAIMEIIGPEEDIVQADITVAVPTDSPEIVAKNAVYLLAFFKTIFPRDYERLNDWWQANLQRAVKGGETIKTTSGNAAVRLTAMKELGMICVAVEAQ